MFRRSTLVVLILTFASLSSLAEDRGSLRALVLVDYNSVHTVVAKVFDGNIPGRSQMGSDRGHEIRTEIGGVLGDWQRGPFLNPETWLSEETIGEIEAAVSDHVRQLRNPVLHEVPDSILVMFGEGLREAQNIVSVAERISGTINGYGPFLHQSDFLYPRAPIEILTREDENEYVYDAVKRYQYSDGTKPYDSKEITVWKLSMLSADMVQQVRSESMGSYRVVQSDQGFLPTLGDAQDQMYVDIPFKKFSRVNDKFGPNLFEEGVAEMMAEEWGSQILPSYRKMRGLSFDSEHEVIVIGEDFGFVVQDRINSMFDMEQTYFENAPNLVTVSDLRTWLRVTNSILTEGVEWTQDFTRYSVADQGVDMFSVYAQMHASGVRRVVYEPKVTLHDVLLEDDTFFKHDPRIQEQ